MALRKIILGVRTAACTLCSDMVGDFGMIDIRLGYLNQN